MLLPDGSLLLAIVMFLVLVPLLNKILFKPIVDVLNERDRRTVGSSTDARAILTTIDQKLGAYEEQIRGARSEGYGVIESRRNAATAERQEKIAAARADAEGEIAAARAELSAEADAARARLEADAREIANSISTTVLGRAVGGPRS